MPGSRCLDNQQEAVLTPESLKIVGMELLLRSASQAVNDSLVLLCWRGSIPREAFEIIDEHGNLIDDDANLPPQFVSQPPSELRDRQVEMGQEADMEQRTQQEAVTIRRQVEQEVEQRTQEEAVTMRLHMLAQHEEWAQKAAMSRRAELIWMQETEARRQLTEHVEIKLQKAQAETARARQNSENVEMELQNAQAMVKKIKFHEETEAARTRQASERHEDLLTRHEQSEEVAARMQRAGKRRNEDSTRAERSPSQCSAACNRRTVRFCRERQPETDEQVASSHEGGHGTPVCSAELQAWLAQHKLPAVHACDDHGWSALHHVAQDFKSERRVLGIFQELCSHVWSPEQLDAVTGKAPVEMHLPEGWTALHLLANGSENGRQRGQMAQRLLEMKANPMTLTPRLATPLHTAAGTGNQDVAEVLLQAPDVDVNWKNKNNKTPYDTASSNKVLRSLIASAGGIPSDDPTGQSARDEPNARKKGGLASEARQQRAALWRSGR